MRTRCTYLNGGQYRATWHFIYSSATNIPNRFTCQESRAEADEAGYEIVRLKDNVTQARWYNTEIDSLFLDTNARSRTPCDNDYYEPYVDNVLPPLVQPFLNKKVMNKVCTLAVSDALWTD